MRSSLRRSPWARSALAALAALAVGVSAATGRAEVTPPRPLAEPALDYPAEGDGRAVSVLLDLVVGVDGTVEDAAARTVAPAGASSAFAARAIEAARGLAFAPARKDGRAVRARVSYLVLFQPRPPPPAAVPPAAPAPAPAPASPPPPISSTQRDEDYARQEVTVAGEKLSSPRGVGDLRIRRELLEASPRLQTSELLSAAPGFFVDHEDGEGIGNDVNVRGFDLDHGSGIEFRVSSVPINAPNHILGPGYADLNFIIPEVVRSVHVVEGIYDPHQGDAAIAGSVDFDLGVAERGYQARASYGSFGQTRLVGIFAPPGEDEETFAAFALRHSPGFGPGNRASSAVSANGQYALELPGACRVRLLAAAGAAQASLAGVVREDDLATGRVGFFDTTPGPYAAGQSAASSRVILGADLDHLTASGHFEATAWAMVTSLRLRQNYTGNVQSSLANPAWSGRGDLVQSTDDEAAAGAGARFQAAPFRPFPFATLRVEPGVALRFGATDQTRALLSPADLSVWDRRIDANLHTLDAGAYLDVEALLFRRLHLTGGLRADALDVSAGDRLANATPAGAAAQTLPGALRNAFGVAVSPKISAGLDVTSWLTPMLSYGEGFRSLDARELKDGATEPLLKVRSAEVGLRAHLRDDRYVASLAFFETRVGNELVFDAVSGGLQTEGASVRRGLVASLVARPLSWLLASLAFSANRATYEALSDDGNHLVPGVAPLLFRADVSARSRLFRAGGHDVQGRVGAGLTVLGARHLTDRITGSPQAILNAGASARYRWVELALDTYNLLDLRYPDDEQYYASSWGRAGGQASASYARHLSAAPPRTALGTLSIYF